MKRWEKPSEKQKQQQLWKFRSKAQNMKLKINQRIYWTHGNDRKD